MQLFYGSYAFPVNNAAVTSRMRTESRAGRPVLYSRRIDVSADLLGTSQADLTLQEVALLAALSTPYQDLVLKTDAGANTGTCLISSSSLSGVYLVDGPNFTRADGPEYVNQRHVEFAFEAEYIPTAAVGAIIDYRDSISVRGNGGPRYVWRFPLNGNAINQQVSLQSLMTTVHSGSAVGVTGFPTAPLPFAGRPPGVFVNESEGVMKGTPEQHGKGFTRYPISWSYEYRHVTPLAGVLPAAPGA